jgi:ABC-2 type transport system ATP-binding protein
VPQTSPTPAPTIPGRQADGANASISAGALPTGGTSARGAAAGSGPTVIRATNVSKKFVSYHKRATSLKEMFVRRGGLSGEDFWALRDVNIEIPRGQTVGLAGANGSGKSTTLKVLAGILRPTSGKVEVNGRIASLLELGAGFNGELSGRDNVYLNAALLGLTKRETDQLFDSIVDFAELRHKIDDEVKHYSSGQYVRLGFAVAVHVDPDILLVDEVLAVGDEAFQRKCLDKVRSFQREGRTIVFVTHALDLVRDLCERAVLLDHGVVQYDGATTQAIREIRDTFEQQAEAEAEAESAKRVALDGAPTYTPMQITDVVITDGAGNPKDEFHPGEPFGVECTVTSPRRVEDWAVGIKVENYKDQTCYASNTHLMGLQLEPIDGSRRVTFSYDSIPLVEGPYHVTLAAHGVNGPHYVRVARIRNFKIIDSEWQDGVVRMPATVDVSPLDTPAVTIG